MPLFTRNKEIGVQSFVLKVVNNSCPELNITEDEARLARRVNLTVVVMIIPVEEGRPRFEEAFTTVTKEFSNTGVAVMLNKPIGLDQVILGFRFEGEMTFLHATARHLNPLGGGFHQLGFKLTDVVPRGEYAQLESLSF